MLYLKTKYPPLVIGAMVVAAVCAAVLFFVLWREYLFYAIAASALLLAWDSLLPDQDIYIHGLSLGLCLGAFAGGVIGFASAPG